ncbi:hypothetical protein Scep_011146 [Stephania cephalantha]|uniref:Major facilitator superfamily (MFS) profile domain-containing protein n=1 Tax=Stephania cephalantha TaxID=152367 RepID=A0AAP0P5L0_9MAGN
MADSSPLLTPGSDSASDPTEKRPHSITLDDAIERCIGKFGRAQFFQSLLVSAAWLFDAQQTFITVFTDAQPTWHCTTTSTTATTESSNSSCYSAPTQCGLPSSSWAWDSPAHTSTISEWALNCSGPILAGLPSSSFFMGCLLGGLVIATLADSLGRKNTLVISTLSMSLFTFLTIFSPNIWAYSALKLLSGFARGSIGTCALVLATELVGQRWRGQVGIIGFFCFTVGFLSLPAIAFFNKGRSWRNLYFISSLPTLLYSLSLHIFVSESPRWLWIKNRKDEAINTLKRISSHNELLVDFNHVVITTSQSQENNDMYSAMKILVQNKWALKRLTTVMILGFGIGLVYYGMPLGVGDLGFNLYLSVTLNALSELPASLITFFLIGRLNRRRSLLGFATASGVASVLCCVGFVGRETKIVMELVSFFSACTAFNVLLIYTLELFPTSVRNSALSMVRQALVMGGVACPLMVMTGRKYGSLIWTYGVFGFVILCSGVFAAFLPETRGAAFCDTMDEQEQHNKNKESLLR